MKRKIAIVTKTITITIVICVYIYVYIYIYFIYYAYLRIIYSTMHNNVVVIEIMNPTDSLHYSIRISITAPLLYLPVPVLTTTKGFMNIINVILELFGSLGWHYLIALFFRPA